ncbi:NB-ARC - like 10 [Theobroma cacao]|nr:NB-ARC - like 10 [Theobroma cacao]
MDLSTLCMKFGNSLGFRDGGISAGALVDLDLATLHSMAVDFAKTRAPAEMPRSLKPREFPNFMQRVDKPILDLEEVGIPFGDQHEGCKILLTSRNQDLLINEIGVKNTFAIDVLNETEAWDLFKEMVENNFEDLELRSVATEVTKKCEGLPVARALKSKDMYAWKDASLKLQSPSPSSFTGIPATLYSAIKLSYNSLEVRNTDRLSCFAVY